VSGSVTPIRAEVTENHALAFVHLQQSILSSISWAITEEGEREFDSRALRSFARMGIQQLQRHPTKELVKDYLKSFHDESYGKGETVKLFGDENYIENIVEVFSNNDDQLLLQEFWKIGWLPALSERLHSSNLDVELVERILNQVASLIGDDNSIDDEDEKFEFDSFEAASAREYEIRLISFHEALRATEKLVDERDTALRATEKLVDERDRYIERLENLLTSIKDKNSLRIYFLALLFKIKGYIKL
jgi:hypothetical protein